MKIFPKNIFNKNVAIIVLIPILLGVIFLGQYVESQSVPKQDILPSIPGQIRIDNIGYIKTDEVSVREKKENVKEAESTFKTRMALSLYDDSLTGSFWRSVGKMPSAHTYDSSATQEFFKKVSQVTGSEQERISEIYKLTTQAIPYYGTPGSAILDVNKVSTFEEALSCQTGICRDQANLLHTALKKSGVRSSIIMGSTGVRPLDHVWVRVITNDGEEFDLDPTWYKDFVKLNSRTVDGPSDVMIKRPVPVPVPTPKPNYEIDGMTGATKIIDKTDIPPAVKPAGVCSDTEYAVLYADTIHGVPGAKEKHDLCVLQRKNNSLLPPAQPVPVPKPVPAPAPKPVPTPIKETEPDEYKPPECSNEGRSPGQLGCFR